MPVGSIAAARRRSGGGSGLSSKWRINITSRQAPANWTSLKEAEFRPSIGGSDAANGGTASASSFGAGPPPTPASSAFDNNTSTIWQTGTSALPNWLEYDFPANLNVEQVVLTPFAQGDTPTAFDVQYDAGGGSWVSYWSTPPNGWVQNTNPLIFSRFNASLAGSTAWRINVSATQGTTGQWCSIQEIELRGSAGGADLSAAGSTDGGNALANVNGGSGNFPWWAFDGTSAPWQSGVAPSVGSPAYIGYRFPTQTDIAEVAIKCTSSPSDAPKNFTIDKWNGSGWTTVKTVTGATWTASQTQTFSVP